MPSAVSLYHRQRERRQQLTTAGAARVAPCSWPRGPWAARLALQTTILVLLLTARYGDARPAVAAAALMMDYVPTDDFAQRTADEEPTPWQDADLRSLCSLTQSVEMKVLCRLTRLRSDSWSGNDARKKPVNKRSDGSSLSAFQRFVSQLRIAAQDRSEAMRQLQQLKAMGVIDENNQVVRLPDETRSLMERLG